MTCVTEHQQFLLFLIPLIIGVVVGGAVGWTLGAEHELNWMGEVLDELFEEQKDAAERP